VAADLGADSVDQRRGGIALLYDVVGQTVAPRGLDVSRLGSRFLAVFGILLGLAAALLVLLFLGRGLLPAVFGPLPHWLPEDVLAGLGYQFCLELLLWLPTLALSALLLASSYWLKPDDLPTGETSALVRLSILATVVAVLFAAATLLAQPWVAARLDDLAFRSTQTQQLEDQYLKLKSLGADHQTADTLEARMSLIKRLGLLRPMQSQRSGNERMDYDFELAILKAHLDLDEFFLLRTVSGKVPPGDESQSTIEALLTKAEAALDDRTSDREFQANLWGLAAYRRLMNDAEQGHPLDTKSLARAQKVVDESWDRIYQKTLAADERLKASYFFRKGKSLGDFQFQNYLESFYGFQELHSENPKDQEVAQHWELSRVKVATQVLFRQEMEVLFAVPGSENLVFLNRESPPEVVKIGKLLNTSQGVFVRDFEFLRFDDQGNVLLHWTAPFGRWGDDGIDFRVWDKERPEPQFPVVLTETPGDEFNPEGSVDPPHFVPRVGVRDLEVVNSDQPRPQTLGTWDLLMHGQAIEALGYNSRLFQTEFVVRLAGPFGFFVAFLFVFALAWRNRAHEPGRTWWFLVPLLPLLTEFVVQTSAWASRLVVGGLLAFFGLETAVAALAIAFVVFSVVGIVLVQRGFRRSLA
jgi:hypothetical protein